MPTIPEALAMAEQAVDAGNAAQARYIYEQILNVLPDEANTLNALGVLEFRAGQLDAAAEYVRRAIDAHPTAAAFHNNLYLIFRSQGRAEDAVNCCRRALQCDPQSPQLHNNLAIALKDTADLEAAVASFERAIAIQPSYADAHYNLANTLAMLDRRERAESEYRRAIELPPHDFEPHNNLGTLLQLEGRFSEAMASFETALRCRADAAEAHRNRALLRLLLGDYVNGWPEYEWRWKMQDARSLAIAAPRWQGEPLSGRTILVWAEQGIGDLIQLVRYADLLHKRGARVIVLCPGNLHSLLKSAPGVDHLLAPGAEAETCDFQIPILSLPTVFSTALETIPASAAYLFAEPDRVARWRRHVSDSEQLKVGIAWQGSRGFAGDRYRSIPLAEFAPVLEQRGVRTFSLQKGLGREQLTALGNHHEIEDLDALLDQDGQAFVDTAALIMNLDLVITSDTAVAHLAGALGARVWLALPLAPNWRWLLERNDSPWYPSMRLFRQRQFGNWADVFADIAEALRSLSSARSLS